MRVMRMSRESASSAMVFVRFSDGDAAYHVAANLERIEAARDDEEGGGK